jgi:hypothetical protein
LIGLDVAPQEEPMVAVRKDKKTGGLFSPPVA